MFCNRGIYHKGWTAVTRHAIPWVVQRANAGVFDDTWELYGPDDWTQAHDLADQQPEKLAELQRLFLLEASKYNVFPLDDRRVERFNPDLAAGPSSSGAAASCCLAAWAGSARTRSSTSRTSRTPSPLRSWSPRRAPTG